MRIMLGAVVTLLLTAGGLLGATPALAAGTAYTWTAGGDGASWGDALNWSPQGTPGDGDAAVVEAASDDVCHAHVTDVPADLHLTDLTIDEILFHGDPDSPCLTSITGGSITVTHLLTFHAGTIDTPITIAAAAGAVVTPGAAHDTTHFSQAVTVDGAMTLTGNAGDEFLSLTGSPGITVDPGAMMTTQGTNRLYANCCNSPAHLVDNGTIQLGGPTTLDSVELDQNALLNATGGAQLLTDFAPQTAGAGARWTGNGSWQLGYSSTTTVPGTQTLAAGFTWRLGGNGSTAEEYLRGSFTLAGSGHFRWGGGAITAAMTVGPQITFTADGGDGPDIRYLDGQGPGTQHVAVTNRGTMTFSGGAGWYGLDGAQLTNASTGVLTLGAGTAVGADCCTNPATVVNSGGQVVVPGGAGTVTIDQTGYRANGGTLSVGPGSDLELTGGAPGSLSATTITGGGTVGVAQPVTTSGTTTTDGGTTVTLEKYGSFTTTGATTLGGAGSFTWTAGAITGTLRVTTGAGQTFAASADAKRILAPAGGGTTTVTFGGPTTLQAGTAKVPNTVQSDPGSRLRFTGPLSLRPNTRFRGGAITTSGTTTVVAGNGSTVVTGNATLTNSGTLAVRTGTLASDEDLLQTAGSTTVSSGATVVIVGSSSVFRVGGGTLAGAGQVTGSAAVGAGTLAPGVGGVGTLTVTGSLTTAAPSTLLFDLGAAARDQLAVGGAANLRGTVRLTDLAGYQPATGDVATVVTAGSLVARFACVTTDGDGAATQHWVTRVVGGTSVQLVSRAGAATSC